jgi:hypothetical protein
MTPRKIYWSRYERQIQWRGGCFTEAPEAPAAGRHAVAESAINASRSGIAFTVTKRPIQINLKATPVCSQAVVIAYTGNLRRMKVNSN